MEVLTLQDLEKFESGTNYNITKKILTGSVTVITKEDHEDERGTFLLVDPVTKISIPCFIDHFTPQLFDVELFIKQWVYVNNKDTDLHYIQLQLLHTFTSAECAESVYFQELQKCNQQYCASLQDKTAFHLPSPFLSSSVKTPANITGIVSAISILFVKPGSPSSFFVQLVDTEKESKAVTTSIMFYGDNLIKYYSYFKIGVPYMFQQLDLAIIGEPPYTTFSFIDTQSQCHIISLDQFYNEIYIAQPALIKRSSQTPPLMISQHTKPRNSTYTGTVTRVIDSLFGIYELDKKMFVCLFHYMGYSPATPYLVNTVIKLHHVHVAFVQPEDGQTSHLFQHLWRAPLYEKESQYMVLVACVKSHIQVISMSMNHKFTESVPSFLELSSADDQIKEYIYMDSLSRHCSFSKLVRQLEIYAALNVKFSGAWDDFETFKHAYTRIRDLTFATTRTRTSDKPRDFINDFFKHETLCAAVGGELTDNTFHVVIESYPFLNQVQETLDQKLEDYDLKLPGSQENRFERGQVPVKMATYELTENYCILGQLKASGDGRLYLTDQRSRCLVLVLGGKVGDFYMVRKCKWVKENLSFVEDKKKDDDVERVPLWSTYMMIQQDALVQLNPYQTCFTVSTRAKKYELSSSLEGTMTVMHVVSKYPIEMIYDEQGQVCFASQVIVWLRSINDSVEVDVDKKYVVTLSSNHKSLKWAHELGAHTDWVIMGTLQINGTSIQLDVDQHAIYPLTIGSAQGFVLKPIDFERQEVEKVYNVSDVLLTSKNPDLAAKTGPSYYQKVVNVQGVVVNKRLMEGFKPYDKMDRAPLYEQLGVGTGRANRKLFVQLRELNGLDVMNLYIDVDRMHYPLGLVVGSVIKIHHLLRRGPPGSPVGVYGVLNESSFIEVVGTLPPVVSLADQKTRTIASFLDPTLGHNEEESDEIYKLFVYIQGILSLSMRWLCQECGSVVKANDCYGMCQDAPRVFMANAYIQVSDGTSSAYVSVDGERLVFSMLQLTMKQADALKSLATSYGEINHGSRESVKMDDEEKHQKRELHGYTLSDLCDRAKAVGQFWLFGKNQVKKINYRKRQLELDERSEKKVKVDHIEELKLDRVSLFDNGQLVRTLEPQKLKLKAVDLEFPEARIVAYDILKQLQ